MIERTTIGTGAVSYMDIRSGEGHAIHQGLLDATTLAASRNTDGQLPPGLPVLANGSPVSGAGQTAYGIVGPEPVQLGSVNKYGNMIFSGILNRKAIEANLGRVLSANELAAIAAAAAAGTMSVLLK